MGVLKKIFRKTTEETITISEDITNEKKAKADINALFKNKNQKICRGCEKLIRSDDGFTKQGGYFWHRPCWKNAKKMTYKLKGM